MQRGRGWATKRWPAAHFATSRNALHAQGVRACFTGGVGQGALEEVKDAGATQPTTDRAHERERARRMISTAKAHVGGDTGSTHIARRWGPGGRAVLRHRPERTCPYGQRQTTLYDPPGSPDRAEAAWKPWGAPSCKKDRAMRKDTLDQIAGARKGRVLVLPTASSTSSTPARAPVDEARALGGRARGRDEHDASARRLGKGPDRPVNSLEDRWRSSQRSRPWTLSSSSTRTALRYHRRFAPDITVKGGDYRAEDLPESAVVEYTVAARRPALARGPVNAADVRKLRGE